LTDIIGKPLDEIQQLDIDVDELTDRELCWIVALGVGDIEDFASWGPGGSIEYYGNNDSKVFPKYTSSWEHAGRVLEAMPAGTETATYSSYRTSGAICCYERRSTDVWNTSRLDKRFKADEATLKEAITKAAAKCVLEGIELEVSQ